MKAVFVMWPKATNETGYFLYSLPVYIAEFRGGGGLLRPSLDPPLVRLMVLCRIFSSCNVGL